MARTRSAKNPGVKNSGAVGLALAHMLGYASYKDLMEAAYAQTRGGAA